MQRQRVWDWISYILVFCSVMVFLRGYSSNSPGQVTIDASNSYAFEGWGTSLAWWANEIGGWPDGPREDIINKLFGPPPGLGLNVVRYNIGAGDSQPKQGFTCPPLRLGGEVPTFEGSDGNWNWDAVSNQRTILQAAKAKIGESGNPFIAEAFANSPPAWMTESGCTSGNTPKSNCTFSFWFININCNNVGQDNLSKAYYDKYADYLSKVVQHFYTSWNIPFRTVEPFNESNPQDGGFPWSSSTCKPQVDCQEGANYLPATQKTIISAVCHLLKGTATTVSAPDENSIDTTIATYKQYDYATKACISQVNTHSYNGSDREGLCKLVLGDMQGHCMQTGNKRLWMSEFGPYNGGQSDFSLARALSLQITQDMNEMHPAAWVYWQPVEASEYGNNYGLLQAPFCSFNTDATISELNSKNDRCNNKSASQIPNVTTMKQYSAMANYSWFIRPGDLILSVDEGKHTLAAFNPHLHTLTIVATNDDTNDHPVTYTLQHFMSVTGTVSAYTTTADKNVDYSRPSYTIPITGAQFSDNVPKQSITTYVIHNISAIDLHTVDWNNFTYSSSCYGNTQPFKTVNGTATNNGINFTVYKPTFGDLTGDGQPEAVIPYSCTSADSGGPWVLIYTGNATHPVLIGDLPLADPNDHLAIVDSVNISNGVLRLTGRGYSETAGHCCPDLHVESSYRWNGSQFVLVDSNVTRLEAGHVLVVKTDTPILDTQGNPIVPRCNGPHNDIGAIVPAGQSVVALRDSPVPQPESKENVYVAYPDPCQPGNDFSHNDTIANGSGAVGYISFNDLAEVRQVKPHPAFPTTRGTAWRDCWGPTTCGDATYPNDNDILTSRDPVLYAWWTGSYWDPHWWHVLDMQGQEAAVYGRDWMVVG